MNQTFSRAALGAADAGILPASRASHILKGNLSGFPYAHPGRPLDSRVAIPSRPRLSVGGMSA